MEFAASPEALHTFPVGTILRLGDGPSDIIVRDADGWRSADSPIDEGTIRERWPDDAHVLVRYKPSEIDISGNLARLGPMPERIRAQLMALLASDLKDKPEFWGVDTAKVRDLVRKAESLSASSPSGGEVGVSSSVALALCADIDRLRARITQLTAK